MAQLELFLKPVVGVHQQLGQIDGQWVVGLRSGGEPIWDHEGCYQYYQLGERRVRTISLADEMARRAVGFFAQTRALSPVHAPAYNCHTLPFALAGRLDTGLLPVLDYQHLALEAATIRTTDTLVPSKFYYAKRPGDDQPAHSFVALDSHTTLSVLGDGQPLVVMDPGTLAGLYDANRFVRYTPIETRLGRAATITS